MMIVETHQIPKMVIVVQTGGGANNNGQTNGEISGSEQGDSESNGDNKIVNTITKEDGTQITTIKDINKGTITTIVTDGTTGEQKTTVEKLQSSSISESNIPKTGESTVRIVCLISIIILSLIAVMTREKSDINKIKIKQKRKR